MAEATKTMNNELGTLIGLIYIFLLAAPLVVVYYSFSPGVVLRLPPEGFTLRWYRELFDIPEPEELIPESATAFVSTRNGFRLRFALAPSGRASGFTLVAGGTELAATRKQ